MYSDWHLLFLTDFAQPAFLRPTIFMSIQNLLVDRNYTLLQQWALLLPGTVSRYNKDAFLRRTFIMLKRGLACQHWYFRLNAQESSSWWFNGTICSGNHLIEEINVAEKPKPRRVVYPFKASIFYWTIGSSRKFHSIKSMSPGSSRKQKKHGMKHWWMASCFGFDAVSHWHFCNGAGKYQLNGRQSPLDCHCC